MKIIDMEVGSAWTFAYGTGKDYLATGNNNGLITVTNLRDKSIVLEKNLNRKIMGITIDYQCTRLAITAWSDEFIIIDIASGEEKTIKMADGKEVTSVSLSSYGNVLVIASEGSYNLFLFFLDSNTFVPLQDTTNNEKQALLDYHYAEFSPSGNYVIAYSWESAQLNAGETISVFDVWQS